jgi:hypothetical protein
MCLHTRKLFLFFSVRKKDDILRALFIPVEDSKPVNFGVKIYYVSTHTKGKQ